MTISNEKELQELQVIGGIVARILQEMMRRAEPGMTTRELDGIGKELFEKYEAVSAPRFTYNFPGYTCISVNEEAAHGIPGDRVLQPGDVVNIDVSAEKNGFFADTGGTCVLPPSNALKDKLCQAGRLALERALSAARAGQPLRGVGHAVEKVANDTGFRIIKNLCSHGVGRALHEEPEEILGYYDPREKRTFTDGLVITLEPFLSTKSRIVTQADDGWTLVGAQGNLSAQFEHTLVVTKGKPILLTVA